MTIVNIKIASETETKLNHVRAELPDCEASATFDETLLALIDVAEGGGAEVLTRMR
jgi:hypothetical protein